MAFQQPAIFRQPQKTYVESRDASPSPQHHQRDLVEQSQEWILFAPSQAESSTNRSRTDRTVGLSHISDLGSANQQSSSLLEEDITEDGELDSLDDGLHAFREPPTYRTSSQQLDVPVLPTHDGLGTFPASSPLVLEQLWQHEQHNPKRKHEGHHRRPSSIQRRLDTIEDFEAQANEEKRIRIEKWRLDQSQALLEEIERATRRKNRKESLRSSTETQHETLGSTPRQSDFLSSDDDDANEPFWRTITRRFIRDVIGIDEPLLSVILGESLPGETTPRPSSPVNLALSEDMQSDHTSNDTWRNKLLQRIAKELGVFVHQLSPHPGAFSSYAATTQVHDYAGIPIRQPPKAKEVETTTSDDALASKLGPDFAPTMRDETHAESWGFEEDHEVSNSNATLNLRQEREYWERELDVKMVFRYLATKFTSSSQREDPAPPPTQSQHDASATRVAIIRQHHPLIARANRPPVRVRRDSRIARRPTSSCASESAKSGHRASALRSGSSRNYWDIGGSAGSGSLMASGGLMGAWGEA